MGKSQLRRQEAVCREHLQALETAVDLGAIATVQQLCRVLAAQRHRPIYLEARPLPPPLAGLWLASRTTDYIFYADDAPPPLQEHTVLHELAHMLLGVQEAVPPDLDHWEARTPLPPLTPHLVLAALTRSCYDDEEESMAELLGSLIEQRWRTARRRDGGMPLQAPSRPAMRWLSEHAGDE
ncbi:MAG TPA: hypothetical protein VF916_00835 [Ktedonobacterales bacterium]|jgi:hypothetical protein